MVSVVDVYSIVFSPLNLRVQAWFTTRVLPVNLVGPFATFRG
jgi:hypothetical protein